MDLLSTSQYDISIILQNNIDGQSYQLSQIATSVTLSTEMMTGEPGKMEITILFDDELRAVELGEGSAVEFRVNGEVHFLGFMHTLSISSDDTVTIECYDTIKYLQLTAFAQRHIETASQFFSRILNKVPQTPPSINIIRESSHRLSEYYFRRKTLYEMIEEGIVDTNIAEEKQYIIRDDGTGTIEFGEVDDFLKEDVVLGDASFTTSYDYETTITESYNVIKIVRDNEELGKRDTWIVYDQENIDRWGEKRLYVDAEENQTDAQIRAMAEMYLEAKNRPRRNMEIEALGINGLKAGDGIIIVIEKSGIRHPIWIKACEHTYTAHEHTMSLELEVGS